MKKNRKEYNNFFVSQGIKLESKDKNCKLYLLGTNLYLYDDKLHCYVLDNLLGLFLNSFCRKYDAFEASPYLPQSYIDLIWNNFHDDNRLIEIKEKYDFTDESFELLKTSLIADIVRYKPREYILESSIKPKYLSMVSDNTDEYAFEINPKLCFWNGQIWSVTDSYSRLEINNVRDLLRPSRISHLQMVGKAEDQHNVIEQLLEDKGLKFIKDSLDREGIIKISDMDKIKEILSPILIESYDDLE